MKADYRYQLHRQFGPGKHIVFIGLNPSTADDSTDDPTIRRMIGYAKAWGYGSMSVVNLFALRSTNPTNMLKHYDPIGAENDSTMKTILDTADLIVACWGNHGSHMNRDMVIKSMGYELYCIAMNKNGHPSHPLYLSSLLKPQILGKVPNK